MTTRMMVTSRESAWACTQKRDRLCMELNRLVSWIEQSRIESEKSNQKFVLHYKAQRR